MHCFSKENRQRERERQRISLLNKRKKLSKNFYTIFSPIFFPIWEDCVLVGPGRKLLGSTKIPPPLPLNQTLLPTIFCPVFSHFFSLFPISPPTKYTIKV